MNASAVRSEGNLDRNGPLTADKVRDLLRYDDETGNFTWRVSVRRAIPAGRQAGHLRKDGYWEISLGKRQYLAHRLAWLYVHGEWPTSDLDHINGRRSDNRIANLRPATRAQNCANSARPKNSTSGVKGVSLHRVTGKWVAYITHDGKRRHLGLFDDIQAASAARTQAAKKAFGEFFRTGGGA